MHSYKLLYQLLLSRASECSPWFETFQKTEKRIFILFFLRFFLYQASNCVAKLSVPRAWFWPWESWKKTKINFIFYIILILI
jgi:hypothetical protein